MKPEYYIRHSIVDIPTALERINLSGDKRRISLTPDTPPVRVYSLRLKTFAFKGTKCVSCGLEASYFALEKDINGDSDAYHLNLWGIKPSGENILFTHDHILARSLGGADTLENTQTMCFPCNNLKGTAERKIKESQ
jgi:hypothetical protein